MTRLLIVGALACTFAAVPGPGASAAPPDPSGLPVAAAPLPAGMAAALQRDLGEGPGQFSARMENQGRATVLEARMRGELGARYAGAWLDDSGRTLSVAVTDPALSGRVRAAGGRPVVVRHSRRDLDGAVAALNTAAGRADRTGRGPAGLTGWYADVPANRVVVQAATAAAGRSFLRAAGVGSVATRVEVAARTAGTLADLRGGDAWFNSTRQGTCSTGFSVRTDILGSPLGYVTAGHCGGAGNQTYGSGPNQTLRQGTMVGSRFPEQDWALVTLASGWNVKPAVATYDRGLVTVTGSAEAPLNSGVCRSGTTTGWRCGYLRGKGETVTTAAGQRVSNLSRTTACADHGDSGGPYVAGTEAQGLLSLGTGTCANGGISYFQPINPVLQAYDVRLVVSFEFTGRERTISGWGSGKCVDVPDQLARTGVALATWTCGGNGNQRWLWAHDGSVRSLGLCMSLVGGGTANGTRVELAGCDQSSRQRFRTTANSDIVSDHAGGKCLDVDGHATGNGGAIQVWACSGRPNQKWTVE